MAIKLASVTNATSTQSHSVPVPSWAQTALYTLDVSSLTGTSPTVQLRVQHKVPDSGSNAYVDVVTGGTIAAAGQLQLAIGRGATGSTNGGTIGANFDAIEAPLSQYTRVQVVTGGTVTDLDYNLYVEFRK